MYAAPATTRPPLTSTTAAFNATSHNTIPHDTNATRTSQPTHSATPTPYNGPRPFNGYITTPPPPPPFNATSGHHSHRTPNKISLQHCSTSTNGPSKHPNHTPTPVTYPHGNLKPTHSGTSCSTSTFGSSAQPPPTNPKRQATYSPAASRTCGSAGSTSYTPTTSNNLSSPPQPPHTSQQMMILAPKPNAWRIVTTTEPHHNAFSPRCPSQP
jgi:hypothetical protein